MITKIAIENFKGVGERVEIELKPITLLFGANSAGKSTVLHALHYAREVFERHNLNADRTVSGGEFVDLGGFATFVHGQDLTRKVVLSFTLDLTTTDLRSYAPPPHPVAIEDRQIDLSADVVKACVSIDVAWSEWLKRPLVSRYSVELNDMHFASLICDDSRGGAVEIDTLAVKHPLVLTGSEVDGEEGSPSYLDAVADLLPTPQSLETPNIGVLEQPDALPEWGLLLKLQLRDLEPPRMPEPRGYLEEKERYEQKSLEYENDYRAQQRTLQLLSQLIVGPGEVLAESLKQLRYVGPLRRTPPRNFLAPRFPDGSRWANGLAAWDRLSFDTELVERVNNWLSDDERLDAGCYLKLRTLRQLDEESELFGMLASGRAFDELDDIGMELRKLPTKRELVLYAGDEPMLPHDVGVGVSQLLPVIVAALADSDHHVAIEQPELHVHPRLQAEIGDVLVAAAASPLMNRFLIETHSEHLILRLLRRIRETHEGTLPSWHPGLTPAQLAVVYLTGGDAPTTAVSLRLRDDGEFLDRWPKGFFEERAEELF